MSFSLENFIAVSSIELLNLAKKTDLLDIVDHYALTSVKPSTLKNEIKHVLIKFLVDEGILDPSFLSSVLVGWLVGCFELNGLLRQYFSLSRAVSQREEKGKEK